MTDNGCSNEGMGRGLMMGIVIGALAGLAVGFLYAPRSGRETREMIKDRADEVKKKAADVIQTVKTRAQAVKERVAGDERSETSE